MYKQIKNFRRTAEELKAFRRHKIAFLNQGYPLDIAENYAWDCFWAARRSKRGGFGMKVSG